MVCQLPAGLLCTQVVCGLQFTAFLFDDGTVMVADPELTDLKTQSKIVKLAAGYQHMMILDEENCVWTYGLNNHG